MKTSLLAAATLLCASLAAADDCTPVPLHASPATIDWRSAGVVRLERDRDAVLIETKETLRRVSAKSGHTIWTYAVEDQERTPEFVVLPDRIAIVRDERNVVSLNRGDGKEMARADAGEWIRFLSGPPLLAVTQATNSEFSTLVRLSPDGTVLSRRTVPRVVDLLMIDGVAVVESEPEAGGPELDTITGYSSARFEPIWSEKSFTFNKQVIDQQLYLGDIFWSKGAKAIDPRSGTVDALIPVRDAFEIGGSEQFDLQVVTSKWRGAWSPYFATCEGLRRNDPLMASTMWRTDLPFHVSATLRDGPRLFVAGSRDTENRYLVVLDWKSGKVERAWSGVPQITKMMRVDDAIIGFDLEAELVAVRVADQ
jgi:hypothetical protein